jgi:FemAB family protein
LQVLFSDNKKFKVLWKELFCRDKLQYPLFTDHGIDYQKEYLESVHFKNISFLIHNKEVPIIGILLTVDEQNNGKYHFSSYGRPIFFLENKSVDLELSKGAKKLFKRQFFKYLDDYEIDNIQYVDFLDMGMISFFGNLLLDIKAVCEPSFSQVIDLSLNENSLHQMVRKSYQSLINWGLNNLKIEVFDYSNYKSDLIYSFKNLHFSVSGKKTRNDKTWEIQGEMVKSREAFIITGFYNDKLLTAALFICSDNYCYYGVSASNREHFDKPLSHSIIWKAILHAKALGLHFFELGEQIFQNENIALTKNSKKELGISKFKRGFGGHIHQRLKIIK